MKCNPYFSQLSADIVAQVGPSILEAETALSDALAILESEGFTYKHRLLNGLQAMRVRLVKLNDRLSDHYVDALGRAGR